MNSIEASIIIVNWNTKEYLDNCISSILSCLKIKSFEIIVVDNGSSDGSIDLVKNKYQNIVLIENSCNLGFSKANNIGINKAKGQYIFLVNSDVIVLNCTFDKLINYLNNNTKVGMVGPKVLNPDGTLQRSCRKFPGVVRNLFVAFGLDRIFQSITYPSHNRLESVDILSGCFIAINRFHLEGVGPLDDNFFFYGEDKDWALRFKKAGIPVKFFPEAAIIHYGGGSSSAEPIRFYKELVSANVKFYQKHYNSILLKYYLAVMFLGYLNRAIGHSLLLFNLKDTDSRLLKVKRYYLASKMTIKAIAKEI